MAAQFTVMKGRPARGELSWMARATSSLPVPDSPTTRTVTSVGAVRPMALNTSSISGLAPMRRPGRARPSGAGVSASLAATARGRRASSRAMPRRRSRSKGLTTKSRAPAFMAWTATSMDSRAVITTTWGAGRRRPSSPTKSRPLPSGRRTSRKTRV